MEGENKNESTDVSAKVESLLSKEEELLARALAQTMKRYHEDPTVKNLRDMEAAKKAMEEINIKKGKKDTHEQLLENAYKKARAAIEKDPTGKNIDAVEKAHKALDAYRAELAAKAKPEDRRFANLLEVLGYLNGEGWKISKSKLYEDRNKLAKEKDGACLKKTVDEYARLCLEKLDGSDQEIVDINKKSRLENEILEEKKKKLQRENEIQAGMYVLRSEAEQKHTAKLALFLTAVDNFLQGGKINMAVEIVEGNKERVTELRNHLKKEFRAMLGEYARRPEFTVPKQSMAEAEELIADANGE